MGERQIVYIPTRSLMGFIAMLFGLGALVVAWAGHGVTRGYWPGGWRFFTTSAVGAFAFVWGFSSFRSGWPHGGNRIGVRPLQALLFVVALVASSSAIMLFFNW